MQQAAGPQPAGATALQQYSTAEQARLSPVSHLVSDMGLLSVDSDASAAAAECDAAEAATMNGGTVADGASARKPAPAAGGAKPGGRRRGNRSGSERRPVAYRERRVGTVPGDLPRQLEKYWLQRYSIFSRCVTGGWGPSWGRGGVQAPRVWPRPGSTPLAGWRSHSCLTCAPPRPQSALMKASGLTPRDGTAPHPRLLRGTRPDARPLPRCTAAPRHPQRWRHWRQRPTRALLTVWRWTPSRAWAATSLRLLRRVLVGGGRKG